MKKRALLEGSPKFVRRVGLQGGKLPSFESSDSAVSKLDLESNESSRSRVADERKNNGEEKRRTSRVSSRARAQNVCHALALSCARANSVRSMRHASLTAAPPRPPRPRSLVHDAESKDAEPGSLQRVDAPRCQKYARGGKGRETSAECRAFSNRLPIICTYIYTLFFLVFFTERGNDYSFFLGRSSVCGFLREERVNFIHSSPIRSVRP